MHLSDEEILSRWVYSTSDLSNEGQRVKSSFFATKHPNGFSVFKTDGICNTRIWRIEEKFNSGLKPCIGRCDLKLIHYLKAELKISVSPPLPRHRDIFGMPVSSIDEIIGENLSKRQYLLNFSEYVAK